MKGLRALGVRVPGPVRALARDGRSFGRTDGNSPLCSIGHRPLWVRCPKGTKKNVIKKKKRDRKEERKKDEDFLSFFIPLLVSLVFSFSFPCLAYSRHRHRHNF